MIKILYEDEELLVARKPAGLESQASRSFEPDMVSEIKSYLYKKKQEKKNQEKNQEKNAKTSIRQEPYVGVIHRLDKPVGGLLVYAKTPKAAKELSLQLQNGRIKKQYLVVFCGKPMHFVDNFVDNLVKDGKSHMARVAKAGEREAKRAELSYCVLAETEREGRPVGLAEVELKTGRYHQIRAQFAAHGLPLYGDGKYGGWGQPLALFAYRLSLVHPKSGQPLHFLELPKSEAFAGFEEVLERLTL